MDDLISKYIDEASFKRQTDFVIGLLEQVETAYNKLKDIKITLQGSTTNNDIINNTKLVEEALKNVAREQKNVTDAAIANAKVQKVEAEAQKQKTADLLIQQKIETEKRKQEAIAAQQRIAEINNEIKEQERLKKVAAASNAPAKAPAGPKLTTEQKLQNTISSTELGSYDQLNAKLKLALLQYNQLSALQRDSATGKGLQDQIISLDTELKKLDSDVGKFGRNVGNYKDGFSGFANVGKEAANKVGDSFKNMAKNIAASIVAFVGIQSIFNFFKQGLEIFEKSEVASARLENSLKNVGGTSKDLAALTDQSKKLREQFQYLSSTDLKEVQQKLVVFGKLSSEQIGEATKTIVDFAANQRITVPEATDVYTKALEGSARALKQYGINVKDAKTEGERFAILQTELGAKVAGSAAVFGASAEGKIEAYSKKLNGLKKTIGEELFPVYESFLNKSDGLIDTFKKAIPALSFLASNILYIVGAYLVWRTALIAFNIIKSVSIAQSYAAAVASGEEALATELASKQTLLGTIIYEAAAIAKRAWAVATRLLTTEINLLNTGLKISPLGIFLSLLGVGVLLFSAMSAKAKDLGNGYDYAKEKNQELIEVQKEANKVFAEEKSTIDELVAKIKDHTLSLGERKKALEELKSYDENYLKSLTLENIETEKGKKLLDDYINSLNRKAIAQAAQSSLTSFAKDELDTNIKQRENTNKFNEALKAQKSAGSGTEYITYSNLVERLRGDGEELNKAIVEIGQKRRILQDIIKGQGNDFADFNKTGGGLKNTLSQPDGSGDGSDKKSKDTQLDTLDLLTKAQENYQKQKYESYAATNKAIADNEKESLDIRLDALNRYSAFQSTIINKDAINEKGDVTKKYKDDLESNKLTLSQKKELQVSYQLDIKRIDNKASDDQIALTKSIADSQENIIKQNAEKILAIKEKLYKALLETNKKQSASDSLDNDKAKYLELSQLDKDFKSGKINTTLEYETQKAAIEKRYSDAKLQIDIDGAEKELAIDIASGKETTDIEAKILSLKLQQLGVEVDATKKAADAKLKIEQELADKKKELLNAGIGLVKSIIDGQFDKEKNALADQLADIDKRTATELASNDAITQSAEKKAANIAIINSKAQIQKEAIDRRQKKVDRDKAIFDRAVSIAEIIANVAKAVTADLKGNKALIPFDIAIGAIQIGAILATPIPKFKDGKFNDYEGPAIVGDGGVPEYVEHADGSIAKTPAHDTLTWLNKTDIVHPDLMSMMYRYAMPVIGVPPDTRNDNTESLERIIQNQTSTLSPLLKQIANKKEVQIGADSGGMTALHRWGSRQVKYIDNNTNW